MYSKNRSNHCVAKEAAQLEEKRENSLKIHARPVKQPRGAIDGFPVEIFAQFILLNKLGTMDVFRGAKKRNTTDAWQSSEKGEREGVVGGLVDP